MEMSRCEFKRSLSVNFILVAEDFGADPIELPVEKDGTLLLSTLRAIFPGATGLKYKNPETKSIRGIRLNDSKLFAPEPEWDVSVLYACVFPRDQKRKNNGALESVAKLKVPRCQSNKCTDLIVFGLWHIDEQVMRDYFETFGEVLMVQLKKDAKGQSRGFGFVRFSNYDAQLKVLGQGHQIDGRWCEVKIPDSVTRTRGSGGINPPNYAENHGQNNMNNPLGKDLKPKMVMNPASIVAAALNQLILQSGIQNQGNNYHQGGSNNQQQQHNQN